MAADLMKRREGSRTAGVFGCTTKRFFKGIVSTDGEVVPGPGEYLHAVGGGRMAALRESWGLCLPHGVAHALTPAPPSPLHPCQLLWVC
jgi:hypothetical protein